MKELVVNYPILVEAAEKLASGTWEVEEAESWLVAANDLVQDEADRVIGLVQESGYYEDSPEEMECGLTALQGFQESIGLLWRYLEEGLEDFLQDAVQLAAEADAMMRQALELNQEVRGTLSFEVLY
ncbi:MAG: hypothetical protein HY319_03940 [Armatimonadetes bacterium]|nr:hypothetical protein [Armatimonadota bacterium]